MRRALIWTLAAFLLGIPTVAGQVPPPGHVLHCSRQCLPSQVNDENVTNTPVNVILYAHIFDVLQRAPLNTMPPDPAQEKDVNQGFLTPTVKVREDVVYFDNNWFHLYQLPRFVQYGANAINQDGPLSFPLKLGTGAKLFWYLSPHAVPQGNSTSSPLGAIGAMPALTVYARIETGRHPFHGTLVAEGRTATPVILAVPGSQGTDYVYEFEVPLTAKVAEIPPEEGFVVSVNWFQYENGEEQVTQGDWRIRTGIRFAPRLILPVENPMRLLEYQSLYRAGTHYLSTALSPVFGAYDIDPFSLNMTFVDGPSQAGDPSPLFYFYNPLKPEVVRVVWAVPAPNDNLRAGEYAFQLTVLNVQHTYRFRENVTLQIIEFGSAKGESSPSFAAAGLAVAVVAAAFLRRPRA